MHDKPYTHYINLSSIAIFFIFFDIRLRIMNEYKESRRQSS